MGIYSHLIYTSHHPNMFLKDNGIVGDTEYRFGLVHSVKGTYKESKLTKGRIELGFGSYIKGTFHDVDPLAMVPQFILKSGEMDLKFYGGYHLKAKFRKNCLGSGTLVLPNQEVVSFKSKKELHQKGFCLLDFNTKYTADLNKPVFLMTLFQIENPNAEDICQKTGYTPMTGRGLLGNDYKLTNFDIQNQLLSNTHIFCLKTDHYEFDLTEKQEDMSILEWRHTSRASHLDSFRDEKLAKRLGAIRRAEF